MTIPKKMTAAVLVAQNEPLRILELDMPDTLSFGQVLVKITCSGICGSQLGEISGVKGKDPYIPHLLGHEGAGVVIKTGPYVTHVKEGDHVVLHWRKGNGLEGAPPLYRHEGQTINAGFVTTFNNYAIVSENRLTPFDPSIDHSTAALFGCAITTGFGVVTNDAKLAMGESLVVFGAGGIGLNIIQGARLTSAYPIIAVDLFENKLEVAKKCGATHFINSEKEDPIAAINKILGSQGSDVVVDNTGNTGVIATAYELTKAQGRTVLVGVPKKGDKVALYSLPLHFGKVLKGSHGGSTQPSTDIPRYMNMMSAGLFSVKDLVTERFKLKDINEAIIRMRDGKIGGRCMVDMNH